MRRSVLALIALFTFAGCDGNADAGASDAPKRLGRCAPGETERGARESGAALSTTLRSFGGVELFINGDVTGFVEDERCRVRVGYVERPRDLEELEKGLAKRAFEETIPLSTFDRISDTQQFFMNNAGDPYSGDYTAKLLVKEVESLQESESHDENEHSPPYATVELRSYREGRMNSKEIFRDISAPPGARLQLTFPATLAGSAQKEELQDIRLLIDTNGDSFVDKNPPAVLRSRRSGFGRD